MALVAGVGLPLAEFEAAVDADEPAFAEMLGSCLSSLAKDADVDEAGVHAATHGVDCDAQLADAHAGWQLAQLGVPREIARTYVSVDAHLRSPSVVGGVSRAARYDADRL